MQSLWVRLFLHGYIILLIESNVGNRKRLDETHEIETLNEFVKNCRHLKSTVRTNDNIKIVR